MKQEPLTIQIGRRIVLREARRMRDPMRRRTGRGSWPTLDKLLFLAIFLGFTGRGLLCPFENFKISCLFIICYGNNLKKSRKF